MKENEKKRWSVKLNTSKCQLDHETYLNIINNRVG